MPEMSRKVYIIFDDRYSPPLRWAFATREDAERFTKDDPFERYQIEEIEYKGRY